MAAKKKSIAKTSQYETPKNISAATKSALIDWNNLYSNINITDITNIRTKFFL